MHAYAYAVAQQICYKAGLTSIEGLDHDLGATITQIHDQCKDWPASIKQATDTVADFWGLSFSDKVLLVTAAQAVLPQ